MTALTLLPLGVDVTLLRGDDVSLTATITDADGQLMNLTGCVVTFTLADSAGTVVATLDWNDGAANGVTVADVAAGVAVITLPHSVTATLRARTGYRYDLQITDAEGLITTVVSGKVTAVQDVSA
jgi:hypothetical protein